MRLRWNTARFNAQREANRSENENETKTDVRHISEPNEDESRYTKRARVEEVGERGGGGKAE